MIFFLEKNLYNFLINKSLNVDKLTYMLLDKPDPQELKKYITPLAYLKMTLINDMLSSAIIHDRHGMSDVDHIDNYAASLTQEENQYVQQDIEIGFKQAQPQGDTEKYYEVIKAPNGHVLIVYDNYIVTHLCASKDHILQLLQEVMSKEYSAQIAYPELLKKYLSVKDSAFSIQTFQLRLLNSLS